MDSEFKRLSAFTSQHSVSRAKSRLALRGMMSSGVSSARERRGDCTQFGKYGRADFAGQSGFVEMSKEEAAQPAGRDCAGEVGIVNSASDTIAELLRG